MVIQSRPIPVILTRPADQGARFGHQLAHRYADRIRLVHSPLLAPHWHAPRIGTGPWAAVIFTSATAVRAVQKIGVVLPRRAWCVGDHTADAAREAGFDAVSAHGDAAALVALIVTGGEQGPLLHLRGEHARGEVAESLRSAGFETSEAVVYTERPQPLTDEARSALTMPQPVILPIFSPRTARYLVVGLNEVNVRAALFAVSMSRAVDEGLTDGRFQVRRIAERPDAQSMIDAIDDALIAAEAA